MDKIEKIIQQELRTPPALSEAFYEQAKEIVKLELGYPSIALEGETDSLEQVLRFSFSRALSLLCEYRPRGRIYEVLFSNGVCEINPANYNISSPTDIYQIIPMQMGISFPVVYPRALGLAGISGQAALGTALVALSTLRTMYHAFALFPTWTVWFIEREENGNKVVYYKICLEPAISVQALMAVLETFRGKDIYSLKDYEMGLVQIEKEWIMKFMRKVSEYHLARIRGRFGETLPLGPLEISQDSSSLLEDYRSIEENLIKELISFSAPPLPMWG